MRNRNTIEFLGIWEQLNNPDFNPIEFEGFRKQAGLTDPLAGAERRRAAEGPAGEIERDKESDDEKWASFDQLENHRSENQRAFGVPLSWEGLEGKKACDIRFTNQAGGYRSSGEQGLALQDTIIGMETDPEQLSGNI